MMERQAVPGAASIFFSEALMPLFRARTLTLEYVLGFPWPTRVVSSCPFTTRSCLLKRTTTRMTRPIELQYPGVRPARIIDNSTIMYYYYYC